MVLIILFFTLSIVLLILSTFSSVNSQCTSIPSKYQSAVAALANSATDFFVSAPGGSPYRMIASITNLASYPWSDVGGTGGITQTTSNGEDCIGGPSDATISILCPPAGKVNFNMDVSYVTSPKCIFTITVYHSSVCTASLVSSSTGLAPPMCGLPPYDFSSLHSDYDWVLPLDNQLTYYYNPCGTVVDPYCRSVSNSATSSLCLRPNNQSGSTINIADGKYSSLNNYVWSYTSGVPADGVTAYTKSGDICSDGMPREVFFYFTCPSESPDHTFSVTQGVSHFNDDGDKLAAPRCIFYVTVFTVTACPLTPPQCGVGPFDLSPLIADNDWVYNGTTAEYYFHPCGIVNNSVCLNQVNTSNAMICAIMHENNVFERVAGGDFNSLTSYVYSYTRGNPAYGLTAYTTSGNQCDDGVPRQTYYYYSCPTSTNLDKTFYITILNPSQGVCIYNVYAYTKLVCV